VSAFIGNQKLKQLPLFKCMRSVKYTYRRI